MLMINTFSHLLCTYSFERLPRPVALSSDNPISRAPERPAVFGALFGLITAPRSEVGKCAAPRGTNAREEQEPLPYFCLHIPVILVILQHLALHAAAPGCCEAGIEARPPRSEI